MFEPITRLSMVPMEIISLGRMYGGVKSPMRVALIFWTVLWGKILTIDNINKRGFSLGGWRCLFCCSGETVDHLLLLCDVVFALWNKVFWMFGVQWVMPPSVLSLLCGQRNGFGKHSLGVWNMVPSCTHVDVASVEGAEFSHV